MSTSKQINSLIKVKKIKQSLDDLPTQQTIGSTKGVDSKWEFVGRTSEVVRVYQNNDDTSENWIDIERDTSVTWKHANGTVMRLPITY